MPAIRSSKRIAEARARALALDHSAQLPLTLQALNRRSPSPSHSTTTVMPSPGSIYKYSGYGEDSDLLLWSSPPASPPSTLASSDGNNLTPMSTSTSSIVRFYSGTTRPNTPTTPTPPSRGARCSHKPPLQRTYAVVLSPSPVDQTTQAPNSMPSLSTTSGSERNGESDMEDMEYTPRRETGASGYNFKMRYLLIFSSRSCNLTRRHGENCRRG